MYSHSIGAPTRILELQMSRTKEQWLQETGGFRFSEAPEQFRQRTEEIAVLRKAISNGQASYDDVCKLAELLGTDDSEE